MLQHDVLSCLADVVDYFVAKVGASARPLHVDHATLSQLDAVLSPSRAYSGSATVSPRTAPVALQHQHTAAAAAAGAGMMPSSSVAFTQFIYSNNAMPPQPTAPGQNWLIVAIVQFNTILF